MPNHFSNIFFCYERGDLSCSRSSGDLFTRENNMLFSRVKISCFRAKAHPHGISLVFFYTIILKETSKFIKQRGLQHKSSSNAKKLSIKVVELPYTLTLSHCVLYF